MKKLKFTLFFLLLASCISHRGAVLKPEGEPTAPATPPGVPFRSNRLTLVVGGAGVASYATVGLLKKFHEEGIETEVLVASGWPAVFALAAGFLKSVHDLEWFATRVGQRDFEKMGEIDFREQIDPSQVLPPIVLRSFPQSLLSQSRIPVVLSATNTDLGEPDVFSSGEWKEPLLRTVSVPGAYRAFSTERGTGWMENIQGLDVREAFRRGASAVVAVSMYDDYLEWLSRSARKADELPRRLYAAQIRKTTREALRLATVSTEIKLGTNPLDFSASRKAFLAGYREAAKLIHKLRQPGSAN